MVDHGFNWSEAARKRKKNPKELILEEGQRKREGA
jgi:hypothetical protein